MTETLHFHFSGERSLRLDKFLAETLSSPPHEISRTQVRSLIDKGMVAVNGKVASKPGSTLKAGTSIEVKLPVEEPSTLLPFDLPLDIVFEDDEMLVINKGPGLSVHPGAGERHKTLANAVLHHLTEEIEEFDDPERPGIVHRLDKDTTGLIVVAKNRISQRNLSEQFAARTAKREYLALAFSTAKRRVFEKDSGVIETRIGRDPKRRKLFAVVKSGGKRAVTRWEVVKRMKHATLLKLSLDTGRTHQIRVHLSYLGAPIIGDKTYGAFTGLPKNLKEAASAFGRQALHAASLSLVHPKTKKALNFYREPPEDFRFIVKFFEVAG